jgi:DNA-damage-inducible protein J
MSANAIVQARIDQSVKDEASVVLASMGLTISDAMRMLLTRVANEQALPFDPLVPNAKTIAAMKEARAGKVKSFNSIDASMADLTSND